MDNICFEKCFYNKESWYNKHDNYKKLVLLVESYFINMKEGLPNSDLAMEIQDILKKLK